MSLVYRPRDPRSNKNGMLDKSLISDHLIRGAAPFVISDSMPHTRHMVTGEYFDSKAKFRATTKAHGCVEVGNEAATLLKPRKPIEMDRGQRREDIKRAIHELRNGR
jgi:hypothetical protein